MEPGEGRLEDCLTHQLEEEEEGDAKGGWSDWLSPLHGTSDGWPPCWMHEMMGDVAWGVELALVKAGPLIAAGLQAEPT